MKYKIVKTISNTYVVVGKTFVGEYASIELAFAAVLEEGENHFEVIRVTPYEWEVTII